MNPSLPPIGKVLNWLEASGFVVSYAYDDLVFVESNAFLLRFDQLDPQKIVIHINMECESDMATELEKKLALEAKSHELTPLKGGRFRLSQKNEEEIDVSFE
jgi:hypothetical protein